jgi:hypothetical protein
MQYPISQMSKAWQGKNLGKVSHQHTLQSMEEVADPDAQQTRSPKIKPAPHASLLLSVSIRFRPW